MPEQKLVHKNLTNDNQARREPTEMETDASNYQTSNCGFTKELISVNQTKDNHIQNIYAKKLSLEGKFLC